MSIDAYTSTVVARISSKYQARVSATTVGILPFHDLLFSQWKRARLPVGNPMSPMKEKKDVLQGTLALMVLTTLDVLGPLHGYAIARGIEQISGELISVDQGTQYPAPQIPVLKSS